MALRAVPNALQFDLGYTALQAGVRVLPAAGAIALVAPLSALLVRAVIGSHRPPRRVVVRRARRLDLSGLGRCRPGDQPSAQRIRAPCRSRSCPGVLYGPFVRGKADIRPWAPRSLMAYAY
jgi:hypothetical protein